MSEKEVNDVLASIFQNTLSIDEDSRESSVLKPDTTIPPTLAKLECPFTWKYNFSCDVIDSISRIENKLLEMEDEDEGLALWKTFVLNIILCYEYAIEGDILEAKDKQMECETVLDAVHNEDSSSTLVMDAGCRHICFACKCFLQYECRLFDECEKTLSMIVPFEDLNNKDKASVLCIRGAFCSEYGYSGISESIVVFEKAVALDDECGEWFFLLGRSLGRLRRLEKRSSIPDHRELKALERAVELSDKAAFMVLLAQSYRETARNVFIEKKRELSSFRPFCDSLNMKAKELYRTVLQQGTLNVHILVRSALGLMKLPNPLKDLAEAEQCILKALDRAPKNGMANHVAGTYYTIVKDYKQAMQYLSKAATCGVFGAEIDIIALKKKQNENYVPIADFERLLGIYKEKPRKEAILCYLGSYFYNIRKDFKKALEYWLQVIEMDINSDNLRVHYDSISQTGSGNINKIVVIEVLKILDNENITEKDRELYEKIIVEYIEHHPGLVASVSDIDVKKYKGNNHRLWRSRPSSQGYTSFGNNPYSRATLKKEAPDVNGSSDDMAYVSRGSCGIVSSSSRSQLGSMSSGSRGQHGNMPSGSRGQHGNMPSGSRGQHGNMPSGSRGQHGNMPSGSRGQHGNMPSGSRGQHGNMLSGSRGQHGNMPSGSRGPHGNLPSSSRGPRGNLHSGSRGSRGNMSSGSRGPHASLPIGNRVPRGKKHSSRNTFFDNAPLGNGSSSSGRSVENQEEHWFERNESNRGAIRKQ